LLRSSLAAAVPARRTQLPRPPRTSHGTAEPHRFQWSRPSPQAMEHAGLRAGEGADPLAGGGEYEQAGSVADAGGGHAQELAMVGLLTRHPSFPRSSDTTEDRLTVVSCGSRRIGAIYHVEEVDVA
jgi:hypothetical protein